MKTTAGLAGSALIGMYAITYGLAMTTVSATQARANLYRLIDQVNETAEPLTITGQRGNAVLVGEDDWSAIVETLHLASIPGMIESIGEAHDEGVAAASKELDW